MSLTEGMFSKGNVLFKTQFVDGSSVVKRYPNKAHCASKQRVTPPVVERGRVMPTENQESA